jgi:serine-type D-Ala-D-Ala endopeptidase (penicillin-binding protein 7)
MNLWALISSIILTFNLTSAPVQHLSTIELVQEGEYNSVVLHDKTYPSGNLPYKKNHNSLGVDITAQAAAVMDKDSGAILWQKNADQVRSLASITKLMTALVFLENNPGWNTEITLEKRDEANSNAPNILRGETVTVKDLFYTSLIASDNNTANALVRSTGLDRNEFVGLMNKKAVNLGLDNTKFKDTTGLNQSNKSTALEILKLANTAFANQDIVEATAKQNYSFQAVTGKHHKIFSTNNLLNSYLDVVAGKTGFIFESGYCLVSEIKNDNGDNIIAVVLGSETNLDRFQDLKILSAWILDNFVWS